MFSLLRALLCPDPTYVLRGYLMFTVHLKEDEDATQLANEASPSLPVSKAAPYAAFA